MPAEQIATNLALINWTVLTGLAVGSFAVVVLARLATPATRGYLAFTAAVRGWVRGAGLPVGRGAAAACSGFPRHRGPDVRRAPPSALALFVALSLVTTVVIARGGRGRLPLLAGLAAGAAVLVLGALTWGEGLIGAVPLAIQLLILAAATGGVFAAMILGHWYLVTPRLPEGPLVLISRRLMWIVALQVRAVRGLGRASGSARAPASPAAARSEHWSDHGRCSSGFD